MIGFPEVLLLIALIVLPIGCITNWVAGFKQMQAGEPLVPQITRDNVPWGLLDLGIILAVVMMISGVGVALITSAQGIEDASSFDSMTPNDQATVFLAFGTATLLSTALSFTWLWLRYQRVDGFSGHHLGSDIELGMRWFMMLVIPVVALQLVLTQWFPTTHPLIEMLKESGDLSFLPVAAFAAVVAAPFFEEAFFRLFLQGWLEKLQITMLRVRLGIGSKADTDAVVVGGTSSARLYVDYEDAASQIEGIDSMSVKSMSVNGPDRDNADHAASRITDEGVRADRSVDRPLMWIPILVSSTLFSLAHFSNGPDWVPLFFLALGLGYLYQRTGRIQACIVVHILVNSLGVIQLWAAVRQP